MNLTRRCKYGLMIYNRKDIWVGKSLEVYGEYCEHEVNLFRAIVKQGQTVLDIGANIGAHTIPLARFVGKTGVVVAFEPERNAFYTLAGNVALNNLRNVYCFHQAIGENVGTIRVPELNFDKTENFGGLTLEGDYEKCPNYPVTLNTIDAIALSSCHFMKIDVEGMELNVLKGAEATIKEYKPILYVEDDRQEKSAALRQFIEGLGYEMYSHQTALYNEDNFDEERENVFVHRSGDQVTSYICANLLCHSKDDSCPVDPDSFGLKRVLPAGGRIRLATADS